MSWLNESHTQIVTNKTDQLTEWLDNVTAQQEAQSPAEDPVFSNEDVYRRFPAIEEAIKRLSRVPKPLPPKKRTLLPGRHLLLRRLQRVMWQKPRG